MTSTYRPRRPGRPRAPRRRLHPSLITALRDSGISRQELIVALGMRPVTVGAVMRGLLCFPATPRKRERLAALAASINHVGPIIVDEAEAFVVAVRS